MTEIIRRGDCVTRPSLDECSKPTRGLSCPWTDENNACPLCQQDFFGLQERHLFNRIPYGRSLRVRRLVSWVV